METIAAAAIIFEGKTYTGFRHCLIIRKIVKETGVKSVAGEQGFTTNTGRFVDRKEALAIAKQANQIKKKHGNQNHLFSEDVWILGVDFHERF